MQVLKYNIKIYHIYIYIYTNKHTSNILGVSKMLGETSGVSYPQQSEFISILVRKPFSRYSPATCWPMIKSVHACTDSVGGRFEHLL
jgi:hypothetical protein